MITGNCFCYDESNKCISRFSFTPIILNNLTDTAKDIKSLISMKYNNNNINKNNNEIKRILNTVQQEGPVFVK